MKYLEDPTSHNVISWHIYSNRWWVVLVALLSAAIQLGRLPSTPLFWVFYIVHLLLVVNCGLLYVFEMKAARFEQAVDGGASQQHKEK
jgi:hypothetical protein